MAGKKKQAGGDDFTRDLISSLNKEHGSKIAYNLQYDDSPTHVNRWVSTGCKQLDVIISNRAVGGGLPEGRIVEIFGPPSIGKSHLAIQVARSTQQMGGIVVYIDTENATSVENLTLLGIDISKRFVYVDTHCTEEVLSIAEETINKARAMEKDVPITIIWDSVAATSPKDELTGDYDKNTIGLNARVISKGMRKINGIIANQNVLFICLNQIRDKIGVMFGDPTTTPGGKAIPFHSSVRLKLGAGSQIKDKKTGEIIGINVWAKTIKNKVAAPFRKVHFQIHFGIGIVEHEELFDVLRPMKPTISNGNSIDVNGTGAWKTFIVKNIKTGEVIEEKKFHKSDFNEILDDPKYASYIEALMDDAFVRHQSPSDEQVVDTESYEEIRQIGIDLGEDFVSPE